MTFALDDALPADVRERIEQSARTRPTDAAANRWRRGESERHLDAGLGSCVLGRPECAEVVANAFSHFEGERWTTHAWVIMPTHVHWLVTVDERVSLSSALHSIKSYTANRINTLTGEQGRLWRKEYFDRYIRDETHFETVRKYIENNPVKAGLCRRPEDWRWSSAWTAAFQAAARHEPATESGASP